MGKSFPLKQRGLCVLGAAEGYFWAGEQVQLVLKCRQVELYFDIKRCVSSGGFNVREEMGLGEPHLYLTTRASSDVEKAERALHGTASL